MVLIIYLIASLLFLKKIAQILESANVLLKYSHINEGKWIIMMLSGLKQNKTKSTKWKCSISEDFTKTESRSSKWNKLNFQNKQWEKQPRFHNSQFLGFFNVYFWERERERESKWGRGRKRRRQNPKQAPGSELFTQSPMGGCWTLNRLSHPGAPTTLNF